MDKSGQTRGFTLIESMISMMIFVVGGLAMAGLIAHGVRMQAFSRDTSMANAAARAKVEELRVIPRTDARRSSGGSLTGDVPNHFDTPAGTSFARRWTVASGPAGTQDVTMAVTWTSTLNSTDPNQRQRTLQLRVLLP
jgi:prepilin-type N-terminal cleavage/methylation domain-containing protein